MRKICIFFLSLWSFHQLCGAYADFSAFADYSIENKTSGGLKATCYHSRGYPKIFHLGGGGGEYWSRSSQPGDCLIKVFVEGTGSPITGLTKEYVLPQNTGCSNRRVSVRLINGDLVIQTDPA